MKQGQNLDVRGTIHAKRVLEVDTVIRTVQGNKAEFP